MTVSYTLEVANARFGGFTKLLFRWKGSIYRLIYKELLVFCGVYLFFSLFYRWLAATLSPAVLCTCLCLSTELDFPLQVYAHAKAAGGLWARGPLLWPVHQRQLHPSSVSAGWVSLERLCLDQIWKKKKGSPELKINSFYFCCRFLCHYGLQPLVGSVH